MRKWIRLGVQLLPLFISSYHTYHRMAKKPEEYTPQENYAFLRPLAQKTAKRMRCEFIIKGEENLPKGQIFLVGNHVSLTDPIVCYAISDRPIAFVSKKEVVKFPFFGKLCTAMKCEYLDREDLRSEIKTFKAIDAKLQKYPDLSFYVFPEGTRSKGPDFKLAPFHAGTFKIPVRRNLPIVPMAIWLSERCLDQKFHYKKYPIQVTYLKPILPEDYQHMTNAEIAALAQSEIEEELLKMKDNDREFVKTLNHYSDKKTDKVLMHKKFKKKA
jgi:1-acyl-sn-glycerol-3-phosphate acyltransferase